MDDLYLIDISNIIHRAFYVHKDLATAQGFPTGAIYGTFRILHTLIKEYHPKNILICYDPAGNTSFRKSIYPEYKASRSPKVVIDAQEIIIRRMVEYLGMASIEAEGYEADDCIASAVANFSDICNIVIVTGDKDLLQLIDTNVTVLDTMKKCFYGADEVNKKFGVKPHQISDYLAIAGDKVDDIPGIEGIGKVGAGKLLSEYETLGEIYEHEDEISGALGKKVRAGKESALISQKLAHLYNDIVPIFPDTKFSPQHSEELLKLFERLEFNNATQKLRLLWEQYKC